MSALPEPERLTTSTEWVFHSMRDGTMIAAHPYSGLAHALGIDAAALVRQVQKLEEPGLPDEGAPATPPFQADPEALRACLDAGILLHRSDHATL